MSNVVLSMKADIKKAIETIQCRNSFSLLQRKMYNVLLANAFSIEEVNSNTTYRISIGLLCKLMGYDSKDYKTIKEKFRELRRMEIEWDITNENGNHVWTNTSPLSLARIIHGEGICEYEFTPSLMPFIKKPAQYAKFSLAAQSRFKSSYGLALYENCERYRKIGQTRYFDITTFRDLMGVSEFEYKDFFAFKNRVISKAIEEVNKYADFEISPEYTKELKKVVGIRFYIKLKKFILEKMNLSDMGTEPKKSGEIYMENTNDGLLYAIVDFNGDLIGGMLSWEELPNSFPRGNVKVYLMQPFHKDILCAISKKGYSKLENCAQQGSAQSVVNDEDILEKKLSKYFGVSKKRYIEYVEKYGKDYLIEKVDGILNSDSFRGGRIKNMGGYLKTALAEDFKEIVGSKEVIRSQSDAQEVLGDLRRKKDKIQSDLENGYRRYLLNNIDIIVLEKIENENKEKLLEQFKTYISNTCYAELYLSKGIEDHLIKDRFVDFLFRDCWDLLQDIAPFGQYIEKNHSEAMVKVDKLTLMIKEHMKSS